MRRDRNKINYILLAVLMLVTTVFLCAYAGINLRCYTAGMDSDVAAEGLTARAMWIHHSVIPETFYGSSETRILNVNLIAAGLYGLTGNMNLSMGIACCIMMLLLIGLYAMLLKRLRFNCVAIAAMVLLLLALPVTVRHAQILYVQAVYYAVHCILMFVTLMMWLQVLHMRKGWIVRTAVSCTLAFVISLSGLRAALICYAPLMLTEILGFLWNRLLPVWSDAGGAAGSERETNDAGGLWIRSGVFTFTTLVAAFLGTRMPTSVSMGTSRNIRHGVSKLASNVIPDMLECVSLGQQDSVRNMLLAMLLILTVISIAAFALLVIRRQSDLQMLGNTAEIADTRESDVAMPDRAVTGRQIAQESQGEDYRVQGDRGWILVFLICSLITTMLMCAFTTTESVWRYYFVAYYVISYAVGLAIDWLMRQDDWFRGVAYVVSATALLYGLLVFHRELLPVLLEPEQRPEYETVIAWMQEHDYYYGYSTYETSNAMTCYANGVVQISAVADLGQMDICKWLTDAVWYGPYVAEETNTAYIIPVSKAEEFAPMLEQHTDLVLSLETEEYNIYTSGTNYSWQ